MDFSGFFTINGLVATEPFPKVSTKAAAPGLALSPGGQGTVLVPLKVVAQSWIFQPGPGPGQDHRLLISPGDLIYVRAEQCIEKWAKPVTLDGSAIPIILVPVRDIQGVSRGQAAVVLPPRPEPTKIV